MVVVVGNEIQLSLELGPSLGSSSKTGLDFRLEVNKDKARGRSSLISQSSIELFWSITGFNHRNYGIFTANCWAR